MAKSKKIKLQKRSAASARLQKGLSLPAGAGGDGYLGFRDMADLKCKYFVRTGNLARLPSHCVCSSFFCPIYLYLCPLQPHGGGNSLEPAFCGGFFRHFIDSLYYTDGYVANFSRRTALP